MFNMQHVGKTISVLRKAQNMTQMELADKLNISFQAVSNWERGQTMPDIAKLSELAEIFGVTIDELLGNGKSARVVEHLIREEPIEQELSAEDFLNVAPLVRPNQAEKLWGNVKADISMKDLALAAPFINESTLDALVIKEAQREKSFASLTRLLPFISREAVDQCLEVVLADGLDIKKMIVAIPFLGRESVNHLADRILKEGSVTDLVVLAPFLKKKKLTEAASFYVKKYSFSKIVPLLPFLDKELLDDFFVNKWSGRE